MPQEITHENRLRNVAEATGRFFDRARNWEKSSPVLVQLGPDFSPSELLALAMLPLGLPRDVRVAVEFRQRAGFTTGDRASAEQCGLGAHRRAVIPAKDDVALASVRRRTSRTSGGWVRIGTGRLLQGSGGPPARDRELGNGAGARRGAGPDRVRLFQQSLRRPQPSLRAGTPTTAWARGGCSGPARRAEVALLVAGLWAKPLAGNRASTRRRGTVFFAIFAVAVSLGCVRLGFWQLARLGERQARNAGVLARLEQEPARLEALLGDTGVRFRRAWVHGRYDFDHELAWATRSRNGSPGVHLLTPLRFGGGDSAVLVDRGWIYFPTACAWIFARREATRRWWMGSSSEYTRRGRRLDFQCRAQVRRLALIRSPRGCRIRWFPWCSCSEWTREAAAAAREIPVRAEPPPLDEGSHRNYAIQWFAFALVGLIGTAFVVARDRTMAAAPDPGSRPSW